MGRPYLFLLNYLGHIHEPVCVPITVVSCGFQSLNKKTTSYLILGAPMFSHLKWDNNSTDLSGLQCNVNYLLTSKALVIVPGT